MGCTDLGKTKFDFVAETEFLCCRILQVFKLLKNGKLNNKV